MKICLQCAQENEDDALRCSRCRYRQFGEPLIPELTHQHTLPAKRGPKFLTTEKAGRLSILKYRTPGEAFLVAGQLEAADILVQFPDDEAMWQEFKEHGFVSLRVSTNSYEAATELRGTIEREHWEDRAREPLSLPMTLAAVAMGIIIFPGAMIFHSLLDSFKMKSYSRKARLFRRWFVVGIAVFFALLMGFARYAR